MKFIHEVQCQHYFINLLKALVFFSQTFFFTIIAWLLWSRVRPQQFSSHIWVWCFKQTCRKTLIPISGKSVDKDVILNVQMVFRQRQTCGGAVLSLIHICSAVLCTLLDTISCLWKLCCFSVTTDKGSLECHSEQFLKKKFFWLICVKSIVFYFVPQNMEDCLTYNEWKLQFSLAFLPRGWWWWSEPSVGHTSVVLISCLALSNYMTVMR